MENPFGMLPKVAPVAFDIDPDNFDTRVFTPVKKKTSEKGIFNPANPRSRFFSGKKSTKFFIVKERKKSLKELKKEWQDSIQPQHEVIEKRAFVSVTKSERDHFKGALHSNTQQLHQFFLKEILPVYLALEPALQQTVDAASHIVGEDADLTLSNELGAMIDDVINLKIFNFMCDKLGMDASSIATVRDRYFKAEPKPRRK